jgi:carbonic anhydrase
MNRVKPILKAKDLPQQYKNSPIEKLFAYHNDNVAFSEYSKADVLIGMCMDNRNSLRMPANFAYIIRTGGANLRYSEFKGSYAIAVGGITHIALLAHTQCGMVQLHEKRDQFIHGLVQNGGWEREWAEDHYNQFAPMFEIGNEIDFVLVEAERLRRRYPKITVVPLMYKVEDNLLYLIDES